MTEYTTPDGTTVVFYWDGNIALAVFPEFTERGFVTCYAQIGQHSYACPTYLDSLQEATSEQCREIKVEVNQIYTNRTFSMEA